MAHSIYKRYYHLIILLIVIAIYEACFLCQGVCIFDEGSFMYAYQHIFSDPASVEFQMMYYNGLIVGGLWNHFFGQLGYIGFRICNVFVIEYLVTITYFTLKDYIKNHWCLVTGILFAVMAWGSGPYIVHHNYVSAAIAVTAVYFMMQAIRNTSYISMAIAGVLIGMNFFTRLPNVAQCGYIIALIPYYIYTRSAKQTSYMFLSAVAGACLGVIIEYMMMEYLGHSTYFIDNIANGLRITSATDSPHNFSFMLIKYLEQYRSILVRIIILAIVPVACVLSNRYAIKKQHMLWVTLVISLSLVLYKIQGPILFIYGFCTIGLILYAWNDKSDMQRICLASVALLMLYLTPLGSDLGIKTLGDTSVYHALPIAVYAVYTTIRNLNTDIRKVSSVYIYALALIYFGFQGWYTLNTCDFDEGPRWEKTYKVNDPLATTYTTKEKANRLNMLLPVLRSYIKPGDYVLDYPGYPLLSYFLNCRSYIGTPWAWTYDSESLENQIEKSERKVKELPVVLRSKGTEIGDFLQYCPDWDNPHGEETYGHHNASVKVVQDFLKRHHYKVAWEDGLFQILTVQ